MLDFRNIAALFVKELIGIRRDTVLMGFVIYAFTLAIYMQATGITHELNRATVGVVDQDVSQLSSAILDALRPPQFQTPVSLSPGEVDRVMDQARFTFVLDIPPNFEADVLAGRSPSVQLLIDATALMQAGIGAGHIQSVVSQEVSRFVTRTEKTTSLPVAIEVRMAFNQTLTTAWFTGTSGLINNVTMLAVLLAGAALVREREHGTLEHLLVMPVRATEIMLSKLLANGLVTLVLTLLSVVFVLDLWIGMRISGSLWLFAAGVLLYLFFATSFGLFLGTISRSMPQMALLFILTVLPMTILSGGMTPLESMPDWLQIGVQVSPTTHFVSFAQAILFRGAGFAVIWPQFLATAVIGLFFFLFSMARFRSFIAAQQG
ncbi:ABC transporter permease [Ciceribacter sp. RN22]|uniref:ABC transporter permease n=1 Tax=Ciceribacter sp. RN22 TaxID=2954932 RepID=UPI0020934B0A|nr:ABC transporter permease [Ciceribacter sp. RN22]MCO6180082.1 ABC transporter permease [Ciceribacter sp. RN22]